MEFESQVYMHTILQPITIKISILIILDR